MTNPPNSEAKKGIEQPTLVPTLDLPKSGGAIKGIGEKFTANPATGTGNFSVPIGVTAGRGAPELSLSYSSGAGNSPFGLGWNISVPQISRKTERQLPTYNNIEEADTFILSGAEDLVKKMNLENGEWKTETSSKDDFNIVRYRPRTEGLFARIEKWTHQTTQDVHWRSVSGTNVTAVYGETPESRIFDPAHPNHIFSWLICKTFDEKGNITLFDYKEEDNQNLPANLSEFRRKKNQQSQKYLKQISYGNDTPFTESHFLFKVVFDYGEHDTNNPKISEDNIWKVRQDAFSNYRAGFEIRTRRLCQRILVFHDFPDEFGLGTAPRLIQSTDFNYSENPIATQLNSISKIAYEMENGQYVKNEMPPLEFQYSKAILDDRLQKIEAPFQNNVPQGLSGNYQFTDLNAEGLKGVLTETAGAWYYKRNLGEGQFDTIKTVIEKPNWSNLGGGTQLSNIEANGQLYLSQSGVNGGWSKRNEEGEWLPFRNFSENPVIDFSDPDIRYLDLNGDGKPEIVLLRDQVLRWHPNLGEKGYGSEKRSFTTIDENTGIGSIFQNNLEHIFTADMTGDGLADIVRIRNGEICYWANLGYGRFSEKTIMDNAPIFDAPDIFDTKNLRLGDIDGSGTTDILYLAGHKTQYWFNQSGNGFSPPIAIKSFPKTHNQTTVSLVDLLGNGTACLVWSSPLEADSAEPWRYVDIMSSTKPYLLTEVRNNMGSVTRTHYKPSTYFYLKNEREGNPWVTKLPFPVQLVHQTEVEDLITGHRFVSEYAYHHGYYDKWEREFRGFGMVEQWDDETFKNPTENDSLNEFHKPRIHTKTWFHTGAWEQELKISSQFAHEYWNASQLDKSELLDATDWTAIEIREAKRALRGQMLRQEIFTEDDVPEKDNPYVVTESRFQVKRLQPIMEDTKHAVFISLPLETLTAHYERNADDPRLGHEMTLAIDDFGNVLKTAAIAYPRQISSPESIPEQYKLTIIYNENTFFNQDDSAVDWFVKGVPISAASYEILNHPLSYPPLFKRQQMLDMIANTADSDKKILSAQVNYYRANDEANLLNPTSLPLGEVQSLVLPHGTYSLIYTNEILQNAYTEKLLDTEWEDHLKAEKYEEKNHANIDGWWITGGFVQFDPNNFYTTTQAKDAWGNISTIEFDSIGLLPIKVEDPLGNIIIAKYDYRILQPLEITDPNGNRRQAAYDGFGRLIRTAIMGKIGENKGDILGQNPRNTFSPSDTETNIIEYHHDRFWKKQLPNYVHSYTRIEHHSDKPATTKDDWQEARVYSDGFGQELQSKAKIADGKAYYVENGVLKMQNDGERWLGSGRTIYDNKGQAVKQFEPYFSTTKDYEKEDELTMWGVSPFIHYDALGRVIRTDMPDGTFTKVEFTPWIQKTYDANDTVADSEWYKKRTDPAHPDYLNDTKEKAAAEASFVHADLPAIVKTDALGRPVQTEQEIKTTLKSTTGKTVLKIGASGNPIQNAVSKVILDTAGNPLQTIDANGNTALEAVFDLVGRPLKSISNDAGTSYVLYSIDNQPVCSWLPRGHAVRMEYDKFRRPVKVWADEGQGEQLKEAMVYGETFPIPESQNMRGQVWKSFDSGGIAEVMVYDFKGAPLKSARHLFADHTERWTAATILDHTGIDFETFETTIEYDALGRPTKSVAPDGSETKNEYDLSGMLQKVWVKLPHENDFTEKVKSIAYNEKGQRQKIQYGNGITTKYRYDPLSYRLIHIQSHNTQKSGELVQDLYYTYDAVGNITEIEDKAQKVVFNDNQRIDPIQKFEYDSLNRLIKAAGREHTGQQNSSEQITIPVSQNTNNTPATTDLQALQNYTQHYAYDLVGNITRWKQTGANAYTRDYFYQADNNQLLKTERGSQTTDYAYDDAGNIRKLSNQQTDTVWNFENQPVFMDFTSTKQAHYIYDAGGERIRKIIDKGAGATEERIYLGNYEIYREKQGTSTTKERQSLHIADDTGRICLIETLTTENATSVSSPTPVRRYQLSNHLGSVGMEVDEEGDIISYEEYHPYGTTAFYWKNTSISQKRYRYTGKERDAESGLSYHSARYYLPWLGRWLSADPAGMVDGACLYQYSLSNPVMLRDENGMQAHVDSRGRVTDRTPPPTYDEKKLRDEDGMQNNNTMEREPPIVMEKYNPTELGETSLFQNQTPVSYPKSNYKPSILEADLAAIEKIEKVIKDFAKFRYVLDKEKSTGNISYLREIRYEVSWNLFSDKFKSLNLIDYGYALEIFDNEYNRYALKHPIYAQGGTDVGEIMLGSKYNMRQVGCFVTCLTMSLNHLSGDYSKNPKDILEMNKLSFSSGGGVIGGIDKIGLYEIDLNGNKAGTRVSQKDSEQFLSIIEKYSRSKDYAVLLHVDYKGKNKEGKRVKGVYDNKGDHWVKLYEYINSDNMKIADPAGGVLRDLKRKDGQYYFHHKFDKKVVSVRVYGFIK